MIFDKHFYARYLKGHNFDISLATMQLKNYLDWRKKQSIETILVSWFLRLNFAGLWIHTIWQNQRAAT